MVQISDTVRNPNRLGMEHFSKTLKSERPKTGHTHVRISERAYVQKRDEMVRISDSQKSELSHLGH